MVLKMRIDQTSNIIGNHFCMIRWQRSWLPTWQSWQMSSGWSEPNFGGTRPMWVGSLSYDEYDDDGDDGGGDVMTTMMMVMVMMVVVVSMMTLMMISQTRRGSRTLYLWTRQLRAVSWFFSPYGESLSSFLPSLSNQVQLCFTEISLKSHNCRLTLWLPLAGVLLTIYIYWLILWTLMQLRHSIILFCVY